MAHSGHAANACVHNLTQTTQKGSPIELGFRVWKEATPQGFGTQINLKAANDEEMSDWVDQAQSLGYVADHVIDPTYPFFVNKEIYEILDHNEFSLPSKFVPEQDMFICYRKCWTASYVFDHTGDGTIKQLNKNFILHP